MRMPGQEEEDDEPDAMNDEQYEDHNGSKYASVGSAQQPALRYLRASLRVKYPRAVKTYIS